MVENNLKIPPANGQQGPASLTNNEPKNFNLLHADSVIKWIVVRTSHKKYKNVISKAEACEKLNSTRA
jgi:hypothetical protein